VAAPYWVGVHDIDLVHWITGKRCVKVFAKSAGSSMRDLGVDDCILSTITLEDGSLFLLENSWATPPTGGNPRSFLMSVRGSKGVGEVEAYQHGFSVYTSNGDVISNSGQIQFFPDLYGRATGIYRDMIEHFLDRVRAGEEPVITGEDGLAAVRVADAIMESLRAGQEVEVSWA
jgi:predicted dehydrogenase